MVDQTAQVAATWQRCGVEKLSTYAVGGLEQRHLVTTRRRDPCRFQSGRAGTDDCDASYLRGRTRVFELDPQLPSGRGIDRAM